jgi:hypothetical protein
MPSHLPACKTSPTVGSARDALRRDTQVIILKEEGADMFSPAAFVPHPLFTVGGTSWASHPINIQLRYHLLARSQDRSKQAETRHTDRTADKEQA